MNSFREGLRWTICSGVMVYGTVLGLSMANGAYIGYRMKRGEFSFIPSMKANEVEPEEARIKAVEEEKKKAKQRCVEMMLAYGCERGLKFPFHLWMDPQGFLNSWFWRSYAKRATIQYTGKSMKIQF